MDLIKAGDVLLIVILASFIGFLVAYASLAGWYRTAMGRHVMAFMAGATLTIAVRVSRNIFGHWPGYEAMRVSCFVLVILLLWWRIALVFAAQLSRQKGK